MTDCWAVFESTEPGRRHHASGPSLGLTTQNDVDSGKYQVEVGL